jgi:hypothetical protein
MTSIQLNGFDLELPQVSRILHGHVRVSVDVDHVSSRLQHSRAHTPTSTASVTGGVDLPGSTLTHAAVRVSSGAALVRASVVHLAAVIQLNSLVRGQSGASERLMAAMLTAVQQSFDESASASPFGPVDSSLAGVAAIDGWCDSAQLAQMWRPVVDALGAANLSSADVHALLSPHSLSFAAAADLLFAADAALRAATLACALSADAIGLGVSLWSSSSATSTPAQRRIVRDLQMLMEGAVLTRTGSRAPEAFIGSPSVLAATLRSMELVGDELRRAINAHDSAVMVLVPPMPAPAPTSGDGVLVSKLAGHADKLVPAGDDETSLASESRGEPVERGHFVLSGTGAHVAAVSTTVQGLVGALLACAESSVQRSSAVLERYPRADCARRCLAQLASAMCVRLRRIDTSPLSELVQLTPVIPTLLKVLAIECAIAGSVFRHRQSPQCDAAFARSLDAIPEKLRVAAAAFERIGAEAGDEFDLAPAFELFLNPAKMRAINPLIPRAAPPPTTTVVDKKVQRKKQ